jgi:hypothetical protein
MSIEEAREKLQIPLSDDDIRKHDIRFMLYSDLVNYEKVTDLLPKQRDGVIILVRTELTFGHYVSLCRFKNDIMFFDSYGFRVDKNFHKTPEYMRRKLGQDYPHLSYLLNSALDDKFKVTFNEYRFQKISDNTETCGRWCIWFVNYVKRANKPSIDGFIRLVLHESDLYNLDLNILACIKIP